MARAVVLPIVLFIAGALMSVMSLYGIWISLIVGLGLCAYSFIRARGAVMTSSSMRAGAALVIAPLLTVLLVLAGMSGVFDRHWNAARVQLHSDRSLQRPALGRC